MTQVTNPPTLVPQQTAAWCFAAAETMVRAYYGMPTLTQYQIARALAVARAGLDPQFQETWELAQAMDASTGQDENGGANHASQVVSLVRTEWGTVNTADTGGTIVSTLSAQDVRGQIDANRIFVVGNAIHFYVVVGYDDDGATLIVRDPYPPGRGGLVQRTALAGLTAMGGFLAILFPHSVPAHGR